MRKIATLVAAVSLGACSSVFAANEQTPREVVTAAQNGVAIDVVAEGLAHPWCVAFLPGGDMLVTEKVGALRKVGRDGTVSAPIAGVPDVYFRSQAGLFDVALAPDFASSGTVFLAYASGTDGANRTTLMRARLDGDTLKDQAVIFQVARDKDTAAHYGGRIAFLPDDTLLLTIGEGSRYREEAQMPENHLGTIIRLNQDGSVPRNNPFIGNPSVQPEIYSYGHRNGQGLLVDAQTGQIWEHEHGARGGDEINLIKPGRNYGWPVVTTGVDYTFAKITPYTHMEGMEDPVMDWIPSIAPSGFAQVRGDMFASWNGAFLVGGLASTDLRLVEFEGGAPVRETVLLDEFDERIRDVRMGPDGAIYVLTDGEGGKLLRLTPVQ